MQLNRRRLLASAGVLLAGGSGLIAACQGGTDQPTIVVTSAPVAPTAPAAAPTVAPVAAAPAAPTVAVIAPPPTPTAAPRPTPLPTVVAGKPMYQQDAQHTGRSPT